MTAKNLFFCFLVALSFGACKNDKAAAPAAVEMTDGKDGPSAYTKLPEENIPSKEGALTLPVKSATINWVGSKFSGNNHSGTINVKSGEILVKNGFVLGGELVFDMNSIKNTDITDAEKAKDLEDHLKNGDFFETNKFPTATFTIKETFPSMNVEGINRVIIGDLTIKGQTHQVNIPVNLSVTDTEVVAKSLNFSINRTQWGINFHSSVVGTAKDKMISDEILLSFDFSAGN